MNTKKQFLKFYNENGWKIVKNDLSSSHIKSLQKSLKMTAIEHGYPNLDQLAINLNKKNKKKLYQVNMIINKLPEFWNLCTLFANKCQQLFNPKKIFYIVDHSILFGLPDDKRLTYNFHQESNYKKNFSRLITVHFPIFREANINNGAMSGLDKSHKLGNLGYSKKINNKEGFTTLLPANIEKLEKKFSNKVFNLKLKDVLYFDQNLIHKSNFNSSKNCRINAVIRLSDDVHGNFEYVSSNKL